MNYKMMGKFINRILLVEAACMLPALCISLFEGEKDSIRGFALSICIILFLCALLWLLCRKSKGSFFAKEGHVCVGVSWVVMSLLGCLPFWISGEIPHLIDAFFETVSGFTTTGASILSEVEGMAKGMLYWRSFTHWLGGMGVLVLVLAITAGNESRNGFTMHLLRAESPGPSVGKLVPKMKTTAEILYLIYMVLTVLDIVFLLIGGMPLFDSVCTAFGTAGTGGFGIKNDSIAGYSPYIQNVCTVFMILFGVNFSCYYMLLLRQFKSIFRDEELRFYVGMILVSILLITWNLLTCRPEGYYDTVGETVRHASFQVATVVTTTGFATTDFDLWPSFSKTILFLLMFVGASAGSTGGGFKCARLLLIIKSIRRNINQMLRPQKVQVVRINDRMVSEKILDNTNAYLAAYVLIMALSFLLISADGFSFTTNLSAVVACFNNIGPGFDAVGATCNYGGFSDFSKIILSFNMLAGRLEIFPILLLISKSTWEKR